MGMDAFVQTRVSIATKERIRALAQRQGLTESTIVKQLLERMLSETVGPDLSDDDRPLRGLRDRRLYVRLREDDWLLLAERSQGRQLRPATYVSVLVRSHLRSLAPLPREELLALKITIAELGAVGRNLNQIARALIEGYIEVPKWGGVSGDAEDLRGAEGSYEGLVVSKFEVLEPGILGRSEVTQIKLVLPLF